MRPASSSGTLGFGWLAGGLVGGSQVGWFGGWVGWWVGGWVDGLEGGWMVLGGCGWWWVSFATVAFGVIRRPISICSLSSPHCLLVRGDVNTQESEVGEIPLRQI